MYKLNITNEDLKNINIEDINKYINHIEKLTNIKWKIIPDYEDYIISEYGNIISLKHRRILKFHLHKSGNYRIHLSKNNISQKIFLHRLVYSIFIKPIDIKDKIFFKDNNRSNIHYTNLSSKFILPKNLINSKSLLQYNNIITEIPKPIEYENLKKIIDKYKFDDIDNFIKNIQKDTEMKWRSIPNYENYIISEHGNIINLKRRKVLKYAIDKRGYYRVKLYKTYKNKLYKRMFRIYRLVYSAFIDKDIKELQIHHRDENKSNNHYSNLIAVSISDHSKYHYNKNLENYLKECEKIYNLKHEKNLTDKQLGKIFNVSRKNISFKLSRFEVYLYLNRNFEKFKALSRKERNDLYTKIYNNKKTEEKKQRLKEAKKIYDDKIKYNLTYKELAKKYNTSESVIRNQLKDQRIYLYLNEDFDTFDKLSYKEKNKLFNNIIIEDRDKNILKYGKEIEKLKLTGLSDKDVMEAMCMDKGEIKHYYRRYKELKAIKEKYKIE